ALRRREQQEGQDGTRQSESRGRTGPPGSTFGRSRGNHWKLTASTQPGRFEDLGPHSQEQPAKPSKQEGNSCRRQAQEGLRGQGPGQHVRDEQAPVEPPEVSFS